MVVRVETRKEEEKWVNKDSKRVHPGFWEKKDTVTHVRIQGKGDLYFPCTFCSLIVMCNETLIDQWNVRVQKENFDIRGTPSVV